MVSVSPVIDLASASSFMSALEYIDSAVSGIHGRILPRISLRRFDLELSFAGIIPCTIVVLDSSFFVESFVNSCEFFLRPIFIGSEYIYCDLSRLND